jgi:hypothetical protein
MTTNARIAGMREYDEEIGVMSIVSTLAVGCRRKIIVFRWVDGSFWDTKEIQLPHTPRTLAFPSPTTLFMGYTPSEYAILTIPLAASSSVSDLLIRKGEKETVIIAAWLAKMLLFLPRPLLQGAWLPWLALRLVA